MKRSFKNKLYVLYGLLFSWNHLFFAASRVDTDLFNKTKPVATKDQIDADFQKTWGGLLATAGNLPPIMEPTQERMARLPAFYKTPNDYYKRYGLTYDQAQQLYAVSGSDPFKFRKAYEIITQDAQKSNVSIDVALQAHLSGKAIISVPISGPAQPQIPQQKPTSQMVVIPVPGYEQSQIIQQKQVPQPVVIPVQRSIVQQGAMPQQAPMPQQRPIPQSRPVGQLSHQVASQLPPIAAPINEWMVPSYYKKYGIELEQARRLYQLSGNNEQKFQNNYEYVKKVAAQNNRSISDTFEALVAKQVPSAQNPIPGRPARNFWTKSAFAYIPAGGGETIESRADKLVHGTGHFIAETAAKTLERGVLWTQPEFLDKGGYYVENPDKNKKFTLLDAVDAVLAHPLIRMALSLTIIGPLDTNKDLKMRQFIMILLVTHYNSYKLILSPMGALNFAVNRILFPIRAASSASKVSIFLMRQALKVFNQYNLNGGNLEQALTNQAAHLMFGQVGTVAAGAQRAVSGTIGVIGRGLGAVRRGFGAIFKSK